LRATYILFGTFMIGVGPMEIAEVGRLNEYAGFTLRRA
jgi:hypothetical protein